MIRRPSVGRPSGNDVGPISARSEHGRADKGRGKGHRQSLTSCSPSSLHRHSYRRRQRHCSRERLSVRLAGTLVSHSNGGRCVAGYISLM